MSAVANTSYTSKTFHNLQTATPFPLERLQELEIFDCNVYIGPEIVPRRYSAATLAAELAPYRMGAVVKNHHIPTTYLIAGVAPPEVLTGAVVLNVYSGGLRPCAIRNAISGLKADVRHWYPASHRIMVSFPTVSARAHLEYLGREFDPAWGVPAAYSLPRNALRGLTVLDEESWPPTLRYDVEEVLLDIAERDYVLATGHLCREEVMALCPRAVELGVRRIIVNQAYFSDTGFSVADQVELSRLPGVYIEQSWYPTIAAGATIQGYVDSIKAVGPEKTLLTSCGGQMVGARIPEMWSSFIGELIAAGVTLEEIKVMASANPRRLLFAAEM